MAMYTEDFNKADSTTLGPDLTWTEMTGNLQVVSNAVRVVTTSTHARARADSDLASKNHYAQALVTFGVTVGNGQARVAGRYSAAEDTCYLAALLTTDAGVSFKIRLEKTLAGVLTSPIGSQVDVTADVTTTVPVALRLEVEGDAPNIVLRAYLDSVLKHTVTGQSDIDAGVRGGIGAFDSIGGQVVLDDFETGDLGGGTGWLRHRV